MKNLFYFLVLFAFVVGCNQNTNDDKLNELQSELDKATASTKVEKSTKTFIENGSTANVRLCCTQSSQSTQRVMTHAALQI